jgi:hypothetical protein
MNLKKMKKKLCRAEGEGLHLLGQIHATRQEEAN